jgi:hypothetical protein
MSRLVLTAPEPDARPPRYFDERLYFEAGDDEHPFNKGGLLQMCRVAWNDPHLRVRYSRSRAVWQVISGRAAVVTDITVAEGALEGAALRQALVGRDLWDAFPSPRAFVPDGL